MDAPSDARSVREARDRYFAENGFGPDGDYDKAWVVIRVGRLPVFAFPNTKARAAAVPCHDLHHVATGYATTVTGEAEIGAWEIASGCRHVPAALLLDLLAMYFGLFFAFPKVRDAFYRGRHSKNLYSEPTDVTLDGPVSALRARLELDQPLPAPTAADRAALAFWAAMAVVAGVGPALCIALLVWTWL